MCERRGLNLPWDHASVGVTERLSCAAGLLCPGPRRSGVDLVLQSSDELAWLKKKLGGRASKALGVFNCFESILGANIRKLCAKHEQHLMSLSYVCFQTRGCKR